LLQKVLHKGLVENKYDIEIERRNPKSPLFSVKSFEALNLKPELLKVWKLVILIKVFHA
jgi:ATP-dependent RNA helicase DDX19/DBP5